MPLEGRREEAQPQDAAQPRSKKSPGPGALAARIEDWKARWPQDSAGYRLAANALKTAGGHLAPHQLTEELARSLVARWQQVYAPATVHQRRSALNGLLTYLREFGAPRIALQHVRQGKAREVTATPEQLQALLHHAPPHLRLLTLLCLETALRFSEALAVTPANHDPTAQTITVPVKGGTQRCIPTTPAIEELLAIAERHGDRSTPCIFTLYGKTVSKNAIHAQWHRLCHKAGIAAEDPFQTVKPHDLRRTTATALYAATKDLRAAQQYLGHSNLTSTLHYLAPLKEEQLRQYHKLLRFHSEVKQ